MKASIFVICCLVVVSILGWGAFYAQSQHTNLLRDRLHQQQSGRFVTQTQARGIDARDVLYQLDNDWVILREGARFDQTADPVMFHAKVRNIRTGEQFNKELDLEIKCPDSIRMVVEHLAEQKIEKELRFEKAKAALEEAAKCF